MAVGEGLEMCATQANALVNKVLLTLHTGGTREEPPLSEGGLGTLWYFSFVSSAQVAGGCQVHACVQPHCG